jgi:DNA-binding GntR family transcriptional regulator
MIRLPQPIPYHLAEQIRRGIIAGRYPPGSPLREQALEQEFGSSRGPIREALRLLELRGLTVHEPRRGFRVREYTSEIVEQIYKLRAQLERYSIEALAACPTGDLPDLLRAENDRMAAHFAARNIEAYLESNVAFHRIIQERTANEPLLRSIAMLNEMAQPIRYALLSRDLDRSRAVAEHQEIIALIEAADFESAAVAMEKHVIGNVRALADLFKASATGERHNLRLAK